MAKKGKPKGKGEKAAPEPAEAPKAPESASPPGGATGWSMGGGEPVRQGLPQPHGGALTPHPPGSNGDVHRGPDRTLRINAMRGLGLQALAKTQLRLVIVEGKKRRVRVEVPMAMCDDIVEGLQLVAREGAAGRHIPEFLQMYFGLHKMMQPGQHENGKNGNGHQPKPATFVVAPSSPPAEEPGTPAQPTAPGTLLGPDGQEYVG